MHVSIPLNILVVVTMTMMLLLVGDCVGRKSNNLLEEYIERVDNEVANFKNIGSCSRKDKHLKNNPGHRTTTTTPEKLDENSKLLQNSYEENIDKVENGNEATSHEEEVPTDVKDYIVENENEVLLHEKEIPENVKDGIENGALCDKTVVPKNITRRNFTRVTLPKFKHLKINQTVTTMLPGDVQVNITVLSLNPFVYEVDGLLDDEECDVMVAIAKSKTLKPIRTNLNRLDITTAEKAFREWDYDQNGYITADEVRLIPSLADIKFTESDVDDMFFVLKMDQNKDGQVDLDEMKNTDLSQITKYLDSLRMTDHQRLRNMTSKGSWVWADEDDMLKYEDYGYFEEYHQRLSTITEIPSEVWQHSEPLQVKHLLPGQFQTPRHDSEPINKDIPCCLYGDTNKLCRKCRYLSFNLFLNDVEEGGDLVFPLANHPFQNIQENSGEWRGYYMYSKTTGSKFYFTVNVTFEANAGDRLRFTAHGREENSEFLFKKATITNNTVSFEKIYNTETESGNVIMYRGKIIENTRFSGYWWVPGQKKMHGIFFMWNREYEIYSTRAVDQSHRNDGCLKSKLRIKPKKGKAVFWYNHHYNPRTGMVGDQNQEAMTAQCEVEKGEKWIASSWLNVIGDGELKLRAWRSGTNLLRDAKTSQKIFDVLGTDEPKLDVEPYEQEYYQEVYGTQSNNNNNNKTDITEMNSGYHKYKPPSNALQALNHLMNDLTNEQLSVLAAKVHRILGLQCV